MMSLKRRWYSGAYSSRASFEPNNTLADNSLAKKLLGLAPEVTFEEGIRELKKEFKIA